MLNETTLSRQSATTTPNVRNAEKLPTPARPPRWPALVDFYGKGNLLLSRSLRSSETWEATTPGAPLDSRSVLVRLLGASSDGMLVVHFERETFQPATGHSVFDDESARLELANVIAGRLLDQDSPWGDRWEWCLSPLALDGPFHSSARDGFAVEYAFQGKTTDSTRWWITASLERIESLKTLTADSIAEPAPAGPDKSCST